jgi:hypothetical protein
MSIFIKILLNPHNLLLFNSRYPPITSIKNVTASVGKN